MGRGLAYATTLALSVAVLVPATWGGDIDSFPLSSYPMFSKRRVDSSFELAQAIGITDGDEDVPLPPRIVGTEEVTHAARTLWRAVRRGRDARRALCREMAARVARSSDEALAGVQRVEIVVRRYDAVGYFSGHPAPLSSRRQARCTVPRESP